MDATRDSQTVMDQEDGMGVGCLQMIQGLTVTCLRTCEFVDGVQLFPLMADRCRVVAPPFICLLFGVL